MSSGIATMTSKLQFTIPATVARALNLHAHAQVAIRVDRPRRRRR
jgi:bifunctional DNA-binding transcriptional regulator/antitoxin component of YhaV-PrlF toxin-antitoxin module